MFYSTNTTNQSFIDMWHELQRKGYTNNIFMLQTIDKDLVNFKLDDLKTLQNDSTKKKERDTLTKKVINEIINNVWFFFREIVRIKSQISINSNYDSEYILNTDETKLIYAYDHDISVITNSSRRKHRGMSTTIILLNIYDAYKKFSVNDSDRIINSLLFINDFTSGLSVTDKFHSLLSSTSPFSFFDTVNKLHTVKSADNNKIDSIIDKYPCDEHIDIIGFFYICDSLHSDKRNYLDLLSIGADRDYGINYLRYPIYVISLFSEFNLEKINNRYIKSIVVEMSKQDAYFYDDININFYKNKMILI